jgi:hypothetical protein
MALTVFFTGLAAFSPAAAEPTMHSLETPIEGTRVLSIRVNKAGRGRIELLCHQCGNGRIRLNVNPESHALVNDNLVPLNQFSPRSGDFTTGFYNPQNNVLTRLSVER